MTPNLLSALLTRDIAPHSQIEDRPESPSDSSAGQRTDALTAPQTITLEWLYHHVPVRFWASLFGVILAAFLAGVLVGQTGFVREVIRLTGWAIIPDVASRAAAEPSPPILTPRQHRLLARILEIQQELGLEYLVILMNGHVYFDQQELRDLRMIDLKVEILRGPPIPEGEPLDPEFERLVDTMPEYYLRRLDREDPNKYMRLGRSAVVTVTDAGLRYLRK